MKRDLFWGTGILELSLPLSDSDSKQSGLLTGVGGEVRGLGTLSSEVGDGDAQCLDTLASGIGDEESLLRGLILSALLTGSSQGDQRSPSSFIWSFSMKIRVFSTRSWRYWGKLWTITDRALSNSSAVSCFDFLAMIVLRRCFARLSEHDGANALISVASLWLIERLSWPLLIVWNIFLHLCFFGAMIVDVEPGVLYLCACVFAMGKL